MRINKLETIFSVLVGILILVFLISKSLSLDYNQYQEYGKVIATLEEKDLTFNQDILLSRYNLFISYDELVNNINTQKELQKQLEEIPDFIDNKGKKRMRTILQERSTLLEQKESLSEWFKSQNALLKNSLRYLPFLASQLEEKSVNVSWYNSLKINLNELLRNLLLYNITTEEELAYTIKAQIQKLSQLKQDYNIEEKEFPIDLTTAHANIILNEKIQVEKLTKELLIPLIEQTKNLGITYDFYFEKAIKTVNTYRLYTYLWSLILLGLLNYLLLKKLYQINPKILEYKEHLETVTTAMVEVENNNLDCENLGSIINRQDELGKLGKEFKQMAEAIKIRQEEFLEEIQQLKLKISDIEEENSDDKNQEYFDFLIADLVLITKNKQKIMETTMLSKLEEIFSKILKQWQCQLIEFQGDLDYVKLVFSYPPQIKLSKLVSKLKSVSNSLIIPEFQNLVNDLDHEIWSNVYLIGSGRDFNFNDVAKNGNDMINIVHTQYDS